MVLFNYATRELTAKIVYYGAGLCGKTTNLEFVHKSLPEKTRGKMLSLATQTDRTLFFDFLPLDLGSLKGMKTRMQLYTVPGQVFYDATRKLVLKGADGIVFVVDSQKEMLQSNLDSWENLKQNLIENNLSIHTIPVVMQFNKRDLPNKMSIKDLNSKINEFKAPFYEAVAITGKGVEETLKGISKLVLQSLSQRFLREPQIEKEEEPLQEEPVEEHKPRSQKSSKLVVVKPPSKEEVTALLKSDEEEVRELPRGVVEGEGDEASMTLEPLVEPQEESATFDELEEVEEIAEVASINPQVKSPTSIEPPERLLSQPSALGRVEIPTSTPSHFGATHSGVATKISSKNEETSLTELASSKDLSIPIEVSIGKGEDEVKLRISINLKIRLLRD